MSDIRAKLEYERRRIAAEIAALGEADAQSEADRVGRAGRASHMAEDATETFEHEKSLALLHNLRGIEEQVLRALAKLEQGTYGMCDECRKPIAAARLEAIPYATLCLDCKAQRERR